MSQTVESPPNGLDSTTNEITGPTDSQKARIGCVCGGIAILAVLGLMVPLPSATRLSSATGNLVHAPLFMTLALVGLWAWHQGDPVVGGRRARVREIIRRGLLVSIAIILCGIAMEAAQELSTRSASVHDAIANSWGVLAAFCLDVSARVAKVITSSSLRSARFLRGAGRVVAILAIAIASRDSIEMLLDIRRVESQFPILGSFEHRKELTRWYFRNAGRGLVNQHVTDGRRAIELRLRPSDVAGMTLCEMHSDWRGLNSLVLDVESAADNQVQKLRFRVSVIDRDCADGKKRPVRKTFWLEPGKPQTLRLDRQLFVAASPEQRLDLSDIRYLDLESYPVDHPTKVFIDHVRVEFDSSQVPAK